MANVHRLLHTCQCFLGQLPIQAGLAHLASQPICRPRPHSPTPRPPALEAVRHRQGLPPSARPFVFSSSSLSSATWIGPTQRIGCLLSSNISDLHESTLTTNSAFPPSMPKMCVLCVPFRVIRQASLFSDSPLYSPPSIERSWPQIETRQKRRG